MLPRLLRARVVIAALGAIVAVVATNVAGAPTAAASSPVFVVIVNPDVGETSATREFVARAFLKKTTRWPNGSVIRPVDQAGDSALRRRFTENVLGRSISAVRTWWQQQIFSGNDIPPPELGSDEAVVAFVLREPGAIGYVSASADVKTAKILTLR